MSETSKSVSNNFTKCPEMEFFMNEMESDVVFVIEGQRLPALKSFLRVRNKVFRAMFGENFKESKELCENQKTKEVVIEDTSFEAFKTMIHFFYSEQLLLKDPNDLKLIDEIHRLSDKYEAYRLLDRMAEHMKTIAITNENIELISRIADSSQNKELNDNVMTFIDNNFKDFINKEKSQLIAVNDSTHNNLLKVLADNYHKLKQHSISGFAAMKCSHCNKISHLIKDHASYCSYCGSSRTFLQPYII